MKAYILIGTIIIGSLALLSADSISYPYVNNNSFAIGEKLRYRVTYGFMDAGEAIMEVKSTNKKQGNP